MSRIITMREYDCISQDLETAKKIEDGAKFDNNEWSDKKEWYNMFMELKEFMYSETLDVDENDDSKYFFRLTQKNKKDAIKASNYVGVVQLKSGCQIQILPKISFENDDKDYFITKNVFLKMLNSLKDFNCKHLYNASLDISRLNIFEIFIRLFVMHVEELVSKGLKSSYVAIEDNIPYYKGKLLVSPHIRYNLTHAERFYVCYDEYNVNRPENRLLKAALLFLQRISTDLVNKKRIRQSLMHFELVEPSVNYEADFNKVVIDRTTQFYEYPLRLAKIFLHGKSFTSFAGNSKAISLLFPMEKLFEAYIAKMARNFFQECTVTVQEENKIHSLFNRQDDNVEEKKIFGLQPDVVLEWENCTIIVDTKWKRLINNPKINYGISQADMYQMYAYSKEYKTKHVCVIYPLDSGFMDNNNPSNWEVYTPVKKYINKSNGCENVVVHILMVDLRDDKGLNILFQHIEKIAVKEMRGY